MKRALTAAHLQTIDELRAAGRSVKLIARVVGCSPRTVSDAIHRKMAYARIPLRASTPPDIHDCTIDVPRE